MQSVAVATGTHDLGLLPAGVGQAIAATHFEIDPDYDPGTAAHDAAVLTLATPTAAPTVPMATPEEIKALGPGTTLTIAGWGLTVLPSTVVAHLLLLEQRRPHRLPARRVERRRRRRLGRARVVAPAAGEQGDRHADRRQRRECGAATPPPAPARRRLGRGGWLGGFRRQRRPPR